MKVLARLRFAVPFAATLVLTLLMAAKSTQTPAVLVSLGNSSGQPGSLSQAHMISNPAAVYCTDMGYQYHVIVDGAGGQTDSCSLPDGQVCGAWDFLEGKCGKAFSYCARIGLGERTASDGKNAFSPEYAVCVDAHGKDAGVLTTLFDLAPRLNHCGASNELPDTSAGNPSATLPADSVSPLTLSDSQPAAWDWRDATFNGIRGDWTSPVKNQANCGSCWAFAAVGQSEAVLNLAAGNPALDEDLAEEYLVSDCSSAGSCCGGWHSSALNFIRDQGIPDETCLPYASYTCQCYGTGSCKNCTFDNGNGCSNATCSQRCSDYGSRMLKIDYYGQVGNISNPPATQQALMKQALVKYGPLSVAFSWVGDGGFNPENHVYNCLSSGSLNHAVVIVGYDDAGGYWIVKNSWGTGWNGNGYFKMGYGQCQIEDYVYFAHANSTIEMKNRFFLPVVNRH